MSRGKINNGRPHVSLSSFNAWQINNSFDSLWRRVETKECYEPPNMKWRLHTLLAPSVATKQQAATKGLESVSTRTAVTPWVCALPLIIRWLCIKVDWNHAQESRLLIRCKATRRQCHPLLHFVGELYSKDARGEQFSLNRRYFEDTNICISMNEAVPHTLFTFKITVSHS